jgi:O-antigen biosynthesis protein
MVQACIWAGDDIGVILRNPMHIAASPHPRARPGSGTATSIGAVSTRFSLVTAVYDPPEQAFEDTIGSVLAQSYDDWEWVLVDDRSPSPRVWERLELLASQEPRVRIHRRAENGGIVAASQDALDRATGEFVVLLDHDDVLAEGALARVAAEIEAEPELDYLYSDQDRMTVDGETHARFRKPAWSPERLRHHNYLTHLSVLRRALAVEVGGFRAGYDGSQDHDLLLRVTERARAIVHVPEVLYHWREVPGSAAGDAEAKPWAWDAGVRAVQDHLDRTGIPGTASKGPAPGTYRVDREPDLTTPTSIVVPTIGSTGTVRGEERSMVVETLRSVLATTAHTALEVVVVYDTPTPPEVLTALRALSSDTVPVRLVEFTEPFSFSRKCNVGALHATGTNLVFLNDDMEAVSAGIPEHLTAPLREPGVGATGAKLLFEDDTIQHAGLVYGNGTITHSYYRLRSSALGQYGDLWTNREVSALTGAAFAVRRDVFDEVGGFSELLPVNYNDVDLSLKIRHSGRRLVWLHDVVLYHFESVSRDNTVHDWEKELICRRWGDYREVPERYTTNVHYVVGRNARLAHGDGDPVSDL